MHRTTRFLTLSIPRTIRPYSTKGTFRRLNSAIDQIGKEDSKHSATALKVVRRAGVVTIVIVLCLIFWTSSMAVDVHEAEIEDLTKDVRDKN